MDKHNNSISHLDKCLKNVTMRIARIRVLSAPQLEDIRNLTTGLARSRMTQRTKD